MNGPHRGRHRAADHSKSKRDGSHKKPTQKKNPFVPFILLYRKQPNSVAASTTMGGIEPIVIEDNGVSKADLSTRSYPPEYGGHFEDLMISHEEIRSRVKELAKMLHNDYAGTRPVMLCTLKGACPFYQHLLDALQDLNHGYSMEFLRASSYAGAASTGDVKILGSELKNEDIEYRHIVLVEDIVDTGTTLANLLPKLKEFNPKSVEVCSLLEKRLGEGKEPAVRPKYCGFSIPNKFIVGYGLDYNELYRDLKDIYVISQKGIDFDAKELYESQP